MFTNLHTAPPPETIYDMYFNDVSFDKAMENSLAVDPFNEFGSSMEDLDSNSLADEILNLDDNAIEIAAYQLRMADEHGVDPASVLNTPYGKQTGLSQAELDILTEVYPGLNSLDLYDIEGSFGQADQILNAAGPNIDNLVDTVGQLTEDNNVIGAEQTFLDTAGERLGNYWQWVKDLYPEGGTGGSPLLGVWGGFGSGDDDDDVTHAGFGSKYELDLIAGATDAAANTLNPSVDPFNEFEYGTQDYADAKIGPGYNLDIEVPDVYTMDPVNPELFKLFYSDKSQGYEATFEDMMEQLLLAGLSSEEIQHWVYSPEWEQRAMDAGLNAEILRKQFYDALDLGTTGVDFAGDVLSTTELGDITGEKAAAVAERETETGDVAASITTDADVAAAKADAVAAAAGAAKDWEEDLRARFYQVAYAMPGSGNPRIAAMHDEMWDDTRSLFFLYEGTRLWGKGGIMEDVEAGNVARVKDLETEYMEFLGKYFKNRDSFRYGEDLSNRIDRLATILNKYETSQYANMDATELTDAAWMIPRYLGDYGEAETNRRRLIKLRVTKGRIGYYSQNVARSVGAMMDYYKDIGKTGTEIFGIMTGLYGDQLGGQGGSGIFPSGGIPGGGTQAGMSPTSAQIRAAALANERDAEFRMGKSYAGPGSSEFLDIPAIEMTPENREAAMASNEMLLEWVEAMNALAEEDAAGGPPLSPAATPAGAGAATGGLSEAERLEEENRMLDKYFGL